MFKSLSRYCDSHEFDAMKSHSKPNEIKESKGLGLICLALLMLSIPFGLYYGHNIGSSNLLDTYLNGRRLQALRADYATTTWKDEVELAKSKNASCILKNSPAPVILMSLGRSGSSSTWQLMGDLTGKATSATELSGSSEFKTISFFNDLAPEDRGKWALEFLCEQQRLYPDAGIVGFKWKPFSETFFTEKSIDTLKTIASMNNPQIKIIRSRRNLLDREISNYKHHNNDNGFVPAHCKVDDVECLKLHELASQGLSVPVGEMLEHLFKDYEAEEHVDQVLEDLNVPHIHVSYEKLYFGDDISSEWMRIFEFLGVGPANGLTDQQVHDAMQTAATFNPSHKDTLVNYEEVRDAVKDTPFESMLH